MGSSVRRRAGALASFAVAAIVGAAACDKSSGPAKADGSTVAACLDQPNLLPRPPQGRLPCELIPPGLQLR